MMKAKLEFNWHDKWIGAYDKKKLLISTGDISIGAGGRVYYDVIKTWEQHWWICIIPCVPIHIWWKIDA